MQKRTRWIVIVAGVAVVLLVVFALLPDAALEVETARIAPDTLRVTVTEEGQTRARTRYTVAAPVTGRLGRIDLEEGAAVAQYDVVARLYPPPGGGRDVDVGQAQVAAAEARRVEAEARLAEAEALVAQRERDAARSRALAADSVLSPQEVERDALAAASARQQQAAARATLRAAEAQVAVARAALVGANPESMGGAVAVRAPAAGRVLRVLEQSERVVQAGTPLVEIGGAGGLEVVVAVLTQDAVQIRPGAQVLFENWGGGTTLPGVVRLVEPAAFTEVSALGVEEQRVHVLADLLDAPAGLGTGYRMEAHIVLWEGAGVLTVPTTALFQLDGAWHTFVVEDGKARRRAVRLGHRAAAAAEVLSGLGAGEEVILFPSSDVADGVRVAPRGG